MAFEEEACASLVVGLENRLGVLPEVVVAPDAGAAELVPPRLGNDVVAPEGAPLVAVLVAPEVAVLAAGLPQLNPPPADAPAPDNMLLLGAADEVGAGVFPPRENVGAALDAAWEEAGCVAGVVPRVKAGFAGVEEGVVLPSPPKMLLAGFGVCASWAPAVAPWLPPLNRLGVDVEVGVALLFASEEAPALPPRLKSDGVPEVFAADCPEAAPKRLGVEDAEVVAGFAPPNKEGFDCALPLPCLFCCPNKDWPDCVPPLG